MQGREKPVITFGVMSDCQYADADPTTHIIADTNYSSNRQYRQSPRKLKEAVDFFNTQDLDFVVHVGDFVDRSLDDFGVLRDITDQLTVPFWHVIGNHEYSDEASTPGRVVDLYAMPSRYYTKDLAGYTFVVLDSSEVSIDAYPVGSPEQEGAFEVVEELSREGRKNAYPWNGGISPQQYGWIEAQFEQAKAEGKHVIVLSHHMVYPQGSMTMIGGDQLLELIAKYDNIRAFINGHLHINVMEKKEGIPYITLAGMVEESTNAYGVVQLYQSGEAELQGYGRQQSYSW